MNQEKINIYLPIEIKPREFIPLIVFTSQAIRMGFRVYLGTKQSIVKLIDQKKSKNGVLIYKSGLYKHNIDQFKKKIDHFIILDAEMGYAIPHQMQDLFTKSRVLKGTENLISAYFVSNKVFLKSLKKNFKDLKNKIFLTGSFFYEAWQLKYKKFFTDEINFYKQKYGKFILFSSDLTFLNKSKIELTHKYLLTDGWPHSKAFLKRRYKLSKLRYLEFIKLKNILKDLDKHLKKKIIIRPHPSDPISEWENLSKNLKNISYIYKGDISSAILACSGHLHVGCSTAIQALNYQKPSGYINMSKKNFRNNLPSKFSHNLNTKKKILKFCNQTEKYKSYKKIDNINLNASKNILNQIKKLKPKKHLSDRIDLLTYLKDLIDAYKWYLKKFLIKLINPNKLISNNSMTSPIHQKLMGGIKIKEINYLLKKIPVKRFKVRQILINCFEIEN